MPAQVAVSGLADSIRSAVGTYTVVYRGEFVTSRFPVLVATGQFGSRQRCAADEAFILRLTWNGLLLVLYV